MVKHSLSKLSFFLLLFLLSLPVTAGKMFATEDIALNGKLYQLEIADNDPLRMRGLMHRKSLSGDAGMLFAYKKPGNYRIWMKNTLIPLTVIWLDEQARVITKKILQPCKIRNCPVSAASRPSKFILELNPLEFERFKPGDQLTAILTWNNQNDQ